MNGLNGKATRVGVVGLGYVGLPLGVAFAEEGHYVVGIDNNAQRTASIAAGESHIEDIPSERLAAVIDRITATTDYAKLADCDAVLIAVPTPLTRNREPDLGPLLSSARALAGVLRKGQLIILESTTYPGTTREQLVPLLEESGLTAGEDFNVAFSPERVDPGRTDYTLRTTPKIVGGLTPACLERALALYGLVCDDLVPVSSPERVDPGRTDYTLRNTPKVVGGLTPACTERAVELYRQVCDTVVPVSTPEVAELSKLLENVFRSVNIALVNELAMLCDRMGIDIWEVVDAASTKPYGFMRFEPGPGMGGHCLPVDPFYLSWKAREYGQPTEFIELAGEVNQRMPEFCVARIARALNDLSKPVRGSRVAVFGASYKAGVGDLRESPAVTIMRLLAEQGASVVYHDEYVPEVPQLGLTGESFDAALDGADVAVVVTAHPNVDLEAIVAGAPLVVDFRGVTRHIQAENLVRL